MAQKRIYEDTENTLWIVGDCESVPSGDAFLKVTNDTLITVFVVGVGALLENVEVTEIAYNSSGDLYPSVSELKALCKQLFQNS